MLLIVLTALLVVPSAFSTLSFSPARPVAGQPVTLHVQGDCADAWTVLAVEHSATAVTVSVNPVACVTWPRVLDVPLGAFDAGRFTVSVVIGSDDVYDVTELVVAPAPPVPVPALSPAAALALIAAMVTGALLTLHGR